MNAVEAWEDEDSVARCTATHVVASPAADVTVRCDGQAGHVGPEHQGHLGADAIRWRVEPPAETSAAGGAA